MPQSPDIGQKTDGVISDSWISGQSLIKENCRNCRTSDNIEMKLGTVTKLDKRCKATSKDFDDDVMSKNCEPIVIYDKFGAIQKPDSGRIVCNSYFSLIATFYLTKIENRTKKSLTKLSHYCFE